MADDSRSSPRWLALAMPSAGDLIFIGVLTALLLTPLAVRLLGDAGIGWHIRTGQLTLATHAIPRTDPFSSTMAGKPWFAWEWLYDIIVGELDARLGLNGVVWFTAVIIAAVFCSLFRILVNRGISICIALLLTLLALSASTIHFLARPHVLTWLVTLVWFSILHSTEHQTNTRRKLWLLPLLMLLWVNMHGAFLLGFVLLAIFLLSALWEWYRTREDRLEEVLARIAAQRRGWDLMKVSLASAAVALVNPYGWKLHAHIYSYLTNRFLMDHVEEFQSPNFHGIAEKCFAVLLVITVAALAARARRLRLSDVLTILFAIYAGLYASRNIPVSSILLAVSIAPAFISKAENKQVQTFLQRMTKVELGLHGHFWCVMASIVMLLLCLPHDSPGGLIDAHFSPSRMPVGAVDFVQQNGIQGPLLAPDYWGGYLIYRLYPNEQVVLDDRHDLYGNVFLRSYLQAFHGESHWQDFLNDHPAGCVVLPNNAALTSLLRENRDWKPVYSDSLATAFIRTAAAKP